MTTLPVNILQMIEAMNDTNNHIAMRINYRDSLRTINQEIFKSIKQFDALNNIKEKK
jgi:hypothetical protein